MTRWISVLRTGMMLAPCLVPGGCRPEDRGDGTTPDVSARTAATAPTGLRGVQLVTPQPKPDFSLTTADGKEFDFRRDTKGYLTLLFFGYTNCPDICPVHIANLGRVIKVLPIESARRIRVVFVTTDPERDTPERLAQWLRGFHQGFIGLTGSPEAIRAAQVAAQLMPAARQFDSARAGSYYVAHAAQIIAFTPDDDLAHVIYPFGVRQQDWANDLPILVNGWIR